MSDVGKSDRKRSCAYCGLEVSANALYCPNCLVPIPQPSNHRRPGALSLLLGVSLAFGGPCVWVIGGQLRSQLLVASRQSVVHAASVPRPRAVDQAEALIRSCGAPDRDISTANNDPRPPIPFRVLEYNNQHLQFAFVPGGGAKIGDPPPYRWALSGILDSSSNQRVSLQEAAVRMGCIAPLVAVAEAARNSSAASDPAAPADSNVASTIMDPQ
jgi:hypothetical protein